MLPNRHDDAWSNLMLGYQSPLRRVLSPVFLPTTAVGSLLLLVSIAVRSATLALAVVLALAILELGTARPESAGRRLLHRAGFTDRVRSLARSLFFVAAVAVSGAGAEPVVAYVLGIVAVHAATWRFDVALARVLATRTVTAVKNIGTGLELDGLYRAVEARKSEVTTLLYTFEAPLAAVSVLWARELLSPRSLMWVTAVLGILALSVSEATHQWSERFLRSDRVEQHEQNLRRLIAEHRPVIVAYYTGPPQTGYWINQWLPALNRLDHRILILTREPGNTRQVGVTHHPIVLCRTTTDLGVAVANTVRVVLYFGNAGRNVHMLRYPEFKHVFLNHGDSDKATSASPVVRVYDRIFVAGPVGVERYESAGLGLPPERFAMVGRPQLDGLRRGPLVRRDADHPTLLYAPTFEGFFQDINYSSLQVMGTTIIATVLREMPQVRVVFKPHPYTGLVVPEFARAQDEVVSLLRHAGAPHVVATDDPSMSLHDWFNVADVLITDVSSVASDFMVTERPYLITNPRGIDPVAFRAEFVSCAGAALLRPDGANLLPELTDAFGADTRKDARMETAKRVLGDHPLGAQASFAEAIDAVLREADVAHEGVRSTFGFR